MKAPIRIVLAATLFLSSGLVAQSVWTRNVTWIGLPVPTCVTKQCTAYYVTIVPSGSMKPGTKFSVQYLSTDYKSHRMFWAWGNRWNTGVVPLFGGMLFPNILTGGLIPAVTDRFGTTTISFTLPSKPALPFGTRLVVQAAGEHSTAPGKVAISDAWNTITQLP